jgi:Fe2+ or Zn2+ uptake regulation protein
MNNCQEGLENTKDAQTNVMEFIDMWVRQNKTAVTRQDILAQMTIQGIKKPTIINALKLLIKKGYIRRGYAFSRTTTYVQLRSL